MLNKVYLEKYWLWFPSKLNCSDIMRTEVWLFIEFYHLSLWLKTVVFCVCVCLWDYYIIATTGNGLWKCSKSSLIQPYPKLRKHEILAINFDPDITHPACLIHVWRVQLYFSCGCFHYRKGLIQREGMSLSHIPHIDRIKIKEQINASVHLFMGKRQKEPKTAR